MRDREHLACLRVRDRVIMLERMHFADEIRPASALAPKGVRFAREELEMAAQLVDQFAGSFRPEQLQRHVSRYADEGHPRKGTRQDGRGRRNRGAGGADRPHTLRESVELAKGRRAASAHGHGGRRRSGLAPSARGAGPMSSSLSAGPTGTTEHRQGTGGKSCRKAPCRRHKHRPPTPRQRLDRLVGTWELKGHLVGSDEENIVGEITFAWLEGGFFLQQDAEIEFAGMFRVKARELIGSDHGNRRLRLERLFQLLTHAPPVLVGIFEMTP